MIENPEIIKYIKRAFELREQECYKQAIEMLYKAIAIEPDNIEILFQIGELYYLLGNYIRAIHYPEQVLSIASKHLPSLKLLKNIYIKQQELYSAKEVMETIYNIENNYKNLAELISLYGQLGLLDEIEKHSENLSKSSICLLEYSKAAYNNYDWELAEKLIDSALKLDPENENCILQKAKILFDQNNISDSKNYVLKISDFTQNAEVLNYRGLFALEDSNYIDAIKYFSKAIALEKNNHKYYYNLANAYFFNGWIEESKNSYKKAIDLDPENISYRYSLAYLYYQQKELIKAEKETDIILEADPDNIGANIIKALILNSKNLCIDAEKILKKYVQNGTENEFLLSALAEIESNMGKLEAAQKHISIVTQMFPANIDAQCQLARIYTKQKKYDLAINLMDKLIKDNPNLINAYLIGADAAVLKKDYEKVKDYAQRVISIDINCADGYYYLALARKHEPDYDEAIACMLRAITFNASEAKYYAEMADLYELKGDVSSAFEYAKEAESINHAEEYKILFKKYANLVRGK